MRMPMNEDAVGKIHRQSMLYGKDLCRPAGEQK